MERGNGNALMIPPPPTPWIDRPIRITVKLLATAGTMEPTVKKRRAMRISGLRPKMFEKEPKAGWKTVEHSKNDVPDQKASMAVPLSFSAMVGRATDSDVASRATTRVIWTDQTKSVSLWGSRASRGTHHT